MFKLFLSSRSVNEATSHYLYLIEQSVKATGANIARVYSCKGIQKGDVIITVEAKDFFIVSLYHPFNPKVNWFQGITPEEAMLVYHNPLRKLLWEFFERYTLSRSALNIFVSDAMQTHYASKYHYKKSNYTVIPCYNSALSRQSFFVPGKYTRPKFVYSGNLSSWQCIEEILLTFKSIIQSLPDAELLLLTSDVLLAKSIVKGHGLTQVTVKHVQLGQIGSELEKCKYGFLLRADHLINQVATPTKMNTYMAYGLLPIYSDVVHAFKKHIDLKAYDLRIDPLLSPSAIAQQVIDFEKNHTIDAEVLFQKYRTIFSNFYQDDTYVQQLAVLIKNISRI